MMFPLTKHTPFWFTRGLPNRIRGLWNTAGEVRKGIDAAPKPVAEALRHIRALAWGAAGLALPFAAHAHEGHGLPGVSHWHGTDTWGFVVAAAVAAGVAIWLKGRK